MMIQPFPGLRPRPELAAAIAAPPYDVLDAAEARQMAEGNPHSFLRVSKAEIELAPGVSPYSDQVYTTARARLRAMVQSGWMLRDPRASYYIYRLTMHGRQQTGIVAAASVDDYLSGRIKRHELTRPDKENDRTRLGWELSANSGPVFLVHRRKAALDAAIARCTAPPPTYDFTAPDGVGHTLWVVSDPATCAELSQLYEELPTVYIADGHHRSAAAARICQHARTLAPGGTGTEPYHRFLAVLFPEHQVHIMPYHRLLRDLNGLTRDELLERLSREFTVTPAAAPVEPTRRGEFGMYLRGEWFRLELPPDSPPEADPVAALDVTVLERLVLRPLLGIIDQRRDPRIDFMGGIRGMAGLMAKVDSGAAALAFALFPTSLDQLMAIADADQIMPPKSTWFEPKLRDGLVIQELDLDQLHGDPPHPR